MHAFVLAACAAGVSGASSSSFRITRTPTISMPVAPRFVGFSIEVGSTPEVFLTGGLGGPPRSSYAALMNTLREAGSYPRGPAIRVGGNSADESAWVSAPAPLPLNTTYRITGADLDAYAAAVPAWGGSIILDTTFLYDSPALMLAHTAAAAKRLGPLIESVELGNECASAEGTGSVGEGTMTARPQPARPAPALALHAARALCTAHACHPRSGPLR